MAENLNNKKTDSRIERMKEMMSYGLKVENKKPYRSVEHEHVGADGKTYGIIREGSKFHIKVSDKKKPLKEDYQYIGGFQNHKDHEYDSYANALKHFDMKMSSLNEAYGKNGKTESWNVNARNEIIAEASEKMKLEIARMREIMGNASLIKEGKSGVCKDCKNEIEKKNINLGSAGTGSPLNAGGDFYTEDPKGSDLENIGDLEDSNLKGKQSPKVGNKKTVKEGIEECSGSPIEEDEVAECSTEINEEDDFEETDVEEVDVDTEDDDNFDDIDLDSLDSEDDGVETDDEDLEDFPEEDEEEIDIEGDELEDETSDEVSELKAEISNLRNTIEAIADKLGVSEFDEDEPLYPEDEEEDEYELELDDEEGGEEPEFDFEEDDEEFDSEDGDFEEDDEDVTVYESRAYRQAMMNEETLAHGYKRKGLKGVGEALKGKNHKLKHASDETLDRFERRFVGGGENYTQCGETDECVNEAELHDFGKHPGFRKEPFTYPKPTMSKTQGQWEAGDENSPSKGRKPYASAKGNPKPYGEGETPEKTVNSIAEQVMRKILKNR